MAEWSLTFNMFPFLVSLLSLYCIGARDGVSLFVPLIIVLVIIDVVVVVICCVCCSQKAVLFKLVALLLFLQMLRHVPTLSKRGPVVFDAK